MCTISWLPSQDGYEVRMNRDERRSRPPAMPPSVIDAGEGKAITPRDPEGAGTWVGVNDRGVTVALANVYPADPPPAPLRPRSRGLLVLDALACPDGEAVMDLVEGADTERLQPFHLLAFQPDQPVLAVVWDGRELTRRRYDQPGLVATSSSRDQRAAEGVRRSWFEVQAALHGAFTGPLLDRLHRSRHPEPGAWAVSMERSDAATVSMSTVIVDPETVSFVYTPGPPHRTHPGEPLVLARSCLQAEGPRGKGD
ncbi:MAG: hypothetical protein HKO53_11750 [Gemmatimonadetes bacterium]|nr:hypothetical protein [Gemmatimonadota bacterium]